ncbi:MAG TPA: CGNR zinc finger domain-containing protein [Candidatus Limnocylindrales bacterium]|nr:CGNR zinc finger domain-containing protein [Candidatus Limnocylindrales bacterium]
MAPPIPRTSLERAIAFLNTWDTVAAAPDLVADAAILGRFLRWVHDRPAPITAHDADLVAFRAARVRLRAAFESPDEATAVEALNAILVDRPAVARLERDGETWILRHEPVGPDLIEALLAESALALLEAIRDIGWERLGICAGAPCTCVYVDRSRNRSRKFCSDLCNDRVSQEAYRRRVDAGRSRAGAGPPRA